MLEYLDYFNTKYDNLKLYALLYPYKGHIDKFYQDYTDITICTNSDKHNTDINEYIKKFFTYKNIRILTKKLE